MKRTVTVLQDDIDNGLRESSNRCAVALAVKRDLADLLERDDCGTSEVSVTRGGISLMTCRTGKDSLGGVIQAWCLDYSGENPFEAQVFIDKFDAAVPVEPFKFEIDLMSAVTGE